MRRGTAIQRLLLGGLSLTCSCGYLSGCRSAPKYLAGPDKLLVSHVEEAREAFNEGLLVESRKDYRSALLRAWAIDDPYESGNAAYSLAACYFSDQDLQRAHQWLVNARVDLCRAKQSTGNTWLLAAEIAMAQGCIEEAGVYLDYAARSCPTCEFDQPYRFCNSDALLIETNCKPSCLHRLPWIGRKLQQHKSEQDCETVYRASIQLARAKLALHQSDLQTATSCYQSACSSSEGICDLEFRADLHDVAAQLHEAQGNYNRAAGHRDCEIELLRATANYREIPKILQAAADNYLMADQIDLCIDRLIRCSRIYLARNQIEPSWQMLKHAGELIAEQGCEANRIRFELTALLIQEQLEKAQKVPKGSSTQTSSPSGNSENSHHQETDRRGLGDSTDS